MKNQQLFNILTIPEPCSEHWESMQHNASGAYCEKCAKSVVDFSQKSDNDIVKFFDTNKGDNVCGRFDDRQLHRILLNTTIGNSYRNLALSALIIGMSVLPCDTALSNEKGSLKKKDANEFSDNFRENQKVAVVRIIDEAGEKITGAEVYIKSKGEEKFLARTNNDGAFGIVYLFTNECEIIVRKEGFVDYQATLTLEKNTLRRVIVVKGNYPEDSLQYKFTCKVVDSVGTPIGAAIVRISKLERTLITDEHGTITFEKVPMRKYEVEVCVGDYLSERYTIPINSQESELIYHFKKNVVGEMFSKFGHVNYSDISMDNIGIIE